MKLKKLFLSGLTLSVALQPMLAGALASQFSYNAGGQLSQAVLPQGQTHQYGYDQAGQVVTHSLPNGAAVGYAWDGRGTLASLTDPRGLATSYGVSGLGDVASRASPDTGSATYVRNEAGLVTSRSDGRGTASFSWDALGRMTSASYADATASFAYDTTQVGRLGAMQDASGSTGFNYDSHGNVTSRTQVTTGPAGGAGATLTVQQAYDAAGRLSQVTYPSGRVATYAYDGARVTGISVDGVSALSSVQYLPFGPPVSWQMGSAGAYARTIDTAGHMTAYTFEAGQRTLTWDASNRVTGITNPGGVQWTYGYDNLDRLVSATEGTQGTRAFTWDATGNRVSTTINGAAYAYGVDAASNRLSTSTAPATAASYNYDAAGQMLSDGTRTFSWATAGYLASATSAQGTASYSYNGFGQRVKKVIGTGALASARHYLYAEDGVSLLGEYAQAGAGAPVGTLNEVVYLEGIPVLVLAGGQTYFIQSDHLNTPRTIKNAAGAVVWRWESDAFGIGAANQNPGGVMQFEFNLRLPGQQFDAETGLYYNNARYYDQVTGRYISSDPIGLAGGINTYGYVGGSPENKTDRTGLSEQDISLIITEAQGVSKQMTASGVRAPSLPYLPQSVMSGLWNIGKNIGASSIKNCMDQTEEMVFNLTQVFSRNTGKIKLDDHWTFNRVAEELNGWNHHRWAYAESTNPTDGVVSIDSWRGEYRVYSKQQWAGFVASRPYLILKVNPNASPVQ